MGLAVIWALVVWTAGLISPAACVPRNVDSNICNFTPLRLPTSVVCDLKWKSIEITSAHLPRSARHVKVFNAHKVEVRKNALSRVESIRFMNISTLQIEKNLPIPDQRVVKISVIMDAIRNVILETEAFAHSQQGSLNVAITNSCNHQQCVISPRAFGSSSNSTSILLENIRQAFIYNDAFATIIGSLTLRNVSQSSSRPCERGTFSGRIGKLSLISVTFDEIRQGCFHANYSWRSLVIRSSQLGNIATHGFQGRIEDVQVQESSIGSIDSNGLDLDVTRFSMKACTIQRLKGDALSVRANVSISLQMSNISILEEDALHRLQLSYPGRGIKLDHLSFDQAYNGSLRLADENKVSLRELRFGIPCLCNIRKQASQLLFGRKKPESTLTEENEAKMFQSTFENVRCLHKEAMPTLIDHHCRQCHRGTSNLCSNVPNTPGTYEGSDAPVVPSWILYVSAIASLSLFLVASVIVLLVIRRHRRLVLRRRIHRTKLPPHERITSPDIAHVGSDQPKDDQLMGPKTQACSSDQDSEVFQPEKAKPVVESAIHASIPEELACDEDEPLYEEIPGCEQARELMSGHRTEPTLYAEVNKNKASSNISETSQHPKQTIKPPVYAHVNKGLPTSNSSDMTQQSKATTEPPVYAKIDRGKTTSKTKDTGQHLETTTNLSLYARVNKSKPKTSEQGEGQSADCPQSGTIPQLPVYAQVNRRKPNTNEHGEDQSAGGQQSGTAPGHPVYAQVNKTKPTTTSIEMSQQPEQVRDTPLYAEVSRVAPTTDTVSEGSPQNSLSTTRLYGYAVPARPLLTEAAVPVDQTEPREGSSLHADDSRNTPAETEPETGGLWDNLMDNELYGLTLPPVDWQPGRRRATRADLTSATRPGQSVEH